MISDDERVSVFYEGVLYSSMHSTQRFKGLWLMGGAEAARAFGGVSAS